jgi:hypothetical protein
MTRVSAALRFICIETRRRMARTAEIEEGAGEQLLRAGPRARASWAKVGKKAHIRLCRALRILRTVNKITLLCAGTKTHDKD